MNEMYVLLNNKTGQKVIVIEREKLTAEQVMMRVAQHHNMRPCDLTMKSSWYYPFHIAPTFQYL